MKQLKPHHVYTEKEVKSARRTIGYWLSCRFNSVAACLALAGAPFLYKAVSQWPQIPEYLKIGITAASALIIYATANCIAGIVSEGGIRLGVWEVDRLKPLDPWEIEELAKLAARLPSTKAWVADAISQGLTFRKRDLTVACEEMCAVEARNKLQHAHQALEDAVSAQQANNVSDG
ncbi:hypothetical protein [Methylobacterium radiotolerans]|uniref:hypothetical protein n=1 Tax=Methylobacterium radiotolerans TaxID=31998 RepID=UPI001196BC5D|nr:hypothetical protein [Methylobacterium radiotolerans]GEN01769.1 hypothetical protein MRA01_63080 [Methylobacterium radiotolerans]